MDNMFLRFICSDSISMFCVTLFRIRLAFYPNLSVDSVCSICKMLGVIHRTIAVRELPPNETFKILVSGELRYGMY